MDGKTIYITGNNPNEYFLMHIFWVMTDGDIYCLLIEIRDFNGAHIIKRQQYLIINLGGKITGNFKGRNGYEIMEDGFTLSGEALERVKVGGFPLPNIREEKLQELFEVEAEMDFIKWEDFIDG